MITVLNPLKLNSLYGKEFGLAIGINETSFTLHMEYLFLKFYLGAFVFIVGTVVFYLLFKRFIRHALIVLAVDLMHLLISGILSLVTWRFWPFDFDITYGLLSFPALIAETVVITSSYLMVMFFTIRK